MNQILIKEKINFFQKNGYVIFHQVVPHNLIDRFEKDFNELLVANKPLKISFADRIVPLNTIESSEEKEKYLKYGRFIDLDRFSLLSKQLIFYPIISQFLTDLYQGSKPTNLQTLTYKYSSQQGEHSDKYLVKPEWAGDYNKDSLTASWIALEDASEDNGSLIIYPGSHLIPHKKRLIEDFNDNYREYVEYCRKICQKYQIEPEYFYAKKGDILLWHGDFIHAGGEIKDWTKTRFSIVCHYANIENINSPINRVIYQNLGYFYSELPNPTISLKERLKRLIKLVIGYKYWKHKI